VSDQPVITGEMQVIDGCALVALLADSGPAGSWVAACVAGAALAAPHLATFEAANIFRRQVLSGLLDETQAALAHQDLRALAVQLWPYAPLSARAWELRHNLTVYDASYVALAEMLGTSLITLDARIAKAPGPLCPIFAFRPGGRWRASGGGRAEL
jgi:predicted nucleic acid-binding protein